MAGNVLTHGTRHDLSRDRERSTVHPDMSAEVPAAKRAKLESETSPSGSELTSLAASSSNDVGSASAVDTPTEFITKEMLEEQTRYVPWAHQDPGFGN